MRLKRALCCLSLLVMSATGMAGDIRFQDCAEQFGATARCAWVEVPEDRSVDDGRTIRLRVVVLPSRSDGEREPLLLFPGGPGQGTTTLIPLARGAYPRVQETRDVVFIGQRGAGESNPMHCLEDVAEDPSLLFGALWNRERLRACWERTQAFAAPAHYTTGDHVADVIEVLDRLGYGKVVLWGGSGGTRTVQAFIRAAPDRVLAAVIDGVTAIDYAMPLPFSRFAQRALERVFEDCAAQSECARAFPDPAADLKRLFERVAASPVSTAISLPDGSAATVAVTRGDLAYALRGILYSANAIRGLPAQVHRAAQTGDLSFFAQSLYDRSRVLLGSGMVAVGLHINIYCAEDVPRIEDSAIAPGTAGTFLGDYLVNEYRGACAQWPVAPVPESWYRGFTSQTPTLLLSGYYDPSTPDIAAEDVRSSLPNSRHIVVRDQSHGAGFTCARPVVEEFLVTGRLDGTEDPCPAEPISFATEVPTAP